MSWRLLGVPLLGFLVDSSRYFKLSSGLSRSATSIADIVSRGVEFDLCHVDRLLAYEVSGGGRARADVNDFLIILSEVEIYDEPDDNPPKISKQYRRGSLTATSSVGNGVGVRCDSCR